MLPRKLRRAALRIGFLATSSGNSLKSSGMDVMHAESRCCQKDLEMISVSRSACVALAVLVARPVGAEEPKTYTIPTHETWKVGDVVSRKSTDKKIKKDEKKK